MTDEERNIMRGSAPLGRRIDLGRERTHDTEPDEPMTLREATAHDAAAISANRSRDRRIETLERLSFGTDENPGLLATVNGQAKTLGAIERRLDSLNTALWMIAGSIGSGAVALIVRTVVDVLRK